MSVERAADAGAVAQRTATSRQATDAWALILRVAWLAVLLGVAVEVVVLLAQLAFGDPGGGAQIVTEAVKRVSWPLIVCVGIAFGKAAAKLRPADIEARAMGVAGLLSAPLAFNAARLLHKGVGEALAVSASDPKGWLLVTLGVLKAAQYGLLGWSLARIAARPWGGALAHAGMGLLLGVTFGGAALALTATHSTPTPSTFALVTDGLNEALVPVGCALIVFASEALGKRLTAPGAPAPAVAEG